MITELYRVSGTVIIGSTQDSRSTTYQFDFTNFKELLISKQNQTQSVALTGCSKMATDKTLTNGQFIYISESIKKIKMPYAKLPKKEFKNESKQAKKQKNNDTRQETRALPA
jgi:hypothetical protein